MSLSGNKPPPILEQIHSQQPAAAHYFRLVQLGGSSHVIPPPGTPPLPLRPQATRPGGVPDGTFEIEYYDEEMELMEPVDPSRPATLVVARVGSPTPSGPASTPEARAAETTGATKTKKPLAAPSELMPATVAPSVPAALPEPEGELTSEAWNKSILHRQHVELRELLMEDFTHLVKIRNKLREEMKSWGDERNEVQQKLLTQSQRLVDIHAEIVEQREQDAARRKQEIEHLIEGRPKADYTQLGLGLLSTVEGVVSAIAGRGKKKKAGAKAKQILAALLRYSNPAELHDLLNSPQAAEAFAQRMAEITGKKLPPPKSSAADAVPASTSAAGSDSSKSTGSAAGHVAPPSPGTSVVVEAPGRTSEQGAAPIPGTEPAATLEGRAAP